MKRLTLISILFIVTFHLFAQQQTIDTITFNKTIRSYGILKSTFKNRNTVKDLTLKYRDSIFPNDIALLFKNAENFILINWLSNNNLNKGKTIHFSNIHELKSLKGLSLRMFCIDSFPTRLSNIDSLVYLNFMECNISIIPPEIRNFKSLKTLYLMSNKIIDLPPEIGELDSLEYLYLNYNPLKHIPDGILKLKNLKQLEFSGYYDEETNENISIDYYSEIEKLKTLLSKESIENVKITVPSCDEKKFIRKNIPEKGLRKKLKIINYPRVNIINSDSLKFGFSYSPEYYSNPEISNLNSLLNLNNLEEYNFNHLHFNYRFVANYKSVDLTTSFSFNYNSPDTKKDSVLYCNNNTLSFDLSYDLIRFNNFIISPYFGLKGLISEYHYTFYDSTMTLSKLLSTTDKSKKFSYERWYYDLGLSFKYQVENKLYFLSLRAGYLLPSEKGSWYYEDRKIINDTDSYIKFNAYLSLGIGARFNYFKND